MIGFFVFPLIVVYSLAAMKALDRGGMRQLWVLFAFAFLATVLLAVGLSAAYRVPDAVRQALYLGGFLGLPFSLSTGFLTFAHFFRLRRVGQLIVTLTGGILGFALGLILVTFGLRDQ